MKQSDLQPWTKVNVFHLWLPALYPQHPPMTNFLCVNTWFWTLYKLQLLCSDRSCCVLNNADILDQWLSILLWGIASILCCHMGNEARYVVSNLPRDSQSGWDQASREENQYNRCRCCVAMLETHPMCFVAEYYWVPIGIRESSIVRGKFESFVDGFLFERVRNSRYSTE